MDPIHGTSSIGDDVTCKHFTPKVYVIISKIYTEKEDTSGGNKEVARLTTLSTTLVGRVYIVLGCNDDDCHEKLLICWMTGNYKSRSHGMMRHWKRRNPFMVMKSYVFVAV